LRDDEIKEGAIVIVYAGAHVRMKEIRNPTCIFRLPSGHICVHEFDLRISRAGWIGRHRGSGRRFAAQNRQHEYANG